MSSEARESAFLAIQRLSKHVAGAIRSVEMVVSGVNVYAGCMEPKWIEDAPFSKRLVEHLLRTAAEQIERAPRVLRLMDAIGTDETSYRPDVKALMIEGITEAQQGRAPDPDDPRLARDNGVGYARCRLLSMAFDMWTQVLVNALDAGSMLYPGWGMRGDSGRLLRFSGPCLMKAIDAYTRHCDEAGWTLAQRHAEEGLAIVARLAHESTN
ncbi:hypothetical protein [Polyangium sp. 6x1]|uniref:hypothetical protein n=1 Tax=Polyangium sp. 6x1 TaxID=3042689 RepID=UPI002482408A|nr:hypothetical protein [Polyangium sp. 6x1]MDI1446022.1 hypothetical protein [Polyangium sp. 6x1]